MSRVVLPSIARFTLTMSLTGMPSVMADDQIESGVHAFENGVGGERPAERKRRRPSRRSASRPRPRCRRWELFAGVLEDLAALAGRDAGDDLRAVIQRELGVPRAEAAGDALDEDSGVGFDEDAIGLGKDGLVGSLDSQDPTETTDDNEVHHPLVLEA